MPPFRVGDWLVRPALNRLERDHETLHLEPRVMHLLLHLAAHPGLVLSRIELLDALWGDQVIGEEALTVTVSQLRRALGDDSRSPRYVETIRKGGYRLVASVAPIEEAGPDAAPTGAPPTLSGDSNRRVYARAAVGALALGATVLGLAALQTTPGRGARTAGRPSPPAVLLQGLPFTSYPGSEQQPALSPDGTRVAFAWDGGDGGPFNLYLKQRDTETPLRLTDHDGRDAFPAWSPDGSSVAFVRFDEEAAVFTVPSIGGPESRVATIDPAVGGLDWSPDGRFLALSIGATPEQPFVIALLDLETRSVRRLTEPQAQFTCDAWPAFSPDGSTVAFIRGGHSLQRDIFLVPTAGGEARRLTTSQMRMAGLDWTPDGTSIVFAAAPTGAFGLWRVMVADGTLTPLPTRGEGALSPSLAARSAGLAYVEPRSDRNVWRVPTDSTGEVESEPGPLAASTRLDSSAVVSPDGTAIAFASSRSGSLELWLADRDGGRPRQLTRLGGGYVLEPRWSPDGRHIAFTASPDGRSAVHLVDAASGVVRRLSIDTAHEQLTCWSADGTRVYFSRQERGRWQIWSMAADGSDRRLVTDRGLEALAETEGGRELVFLRPQEPSVRRLDLLTREETEIIGPEAMARWLDEVVVEEGVYAVGRQADGAALVFFDFATATVETLRHLGRVAGSPNLSVAPDRTFALVDRFERLELDLVLVDEFR